MPTPRRDRAVELADQLQTTGVAATADVRQLAGRLPAVLVPPPRLAFDVGAGATATWRLLVVAGTADEWTAWAQLDALLAAVEQLLPVELAEPVQFAPGQGSDPLPAYALTYTETVES